MNVEVGENFGDLFRVNLRLPAEAFRIGWCIQIRDIRGKCISALNVFAQIKRHADLR
jgi:hypothetical protein